MRIPLGDRAVVEVEDGYNYVLKVRGKENWKGAGYFGSLEGAVDKVIKLTLAGEEDVVEVRRLIVGINRTVAAAREVTRDLRANMDDLKQLGDLLAKPTTSNLDKARQLVARALS